MNGYLSREIPNRLETLFRLWRPQALWMLTTVPKSSEEELHEIRIFPVSFKMPVSEVEFFSTFVRQLSPALDQIALLEWDILKARTRAMMRKEGEYDYRLWLKGEAGARLERHFAHALGLRWYDLCYRREATLRAEQRIVGAMIILETLFGEEKSGSKWEIRERAARLLGGDAEETQCLREGLDEHYELRNAIVHAGTFTRQSPRTSKISILDVSRRALVVHIAASVGASLTREQIIAMIDGQRAGVVREEARRFLGGEPWVDRVVGKEAVD